VEDRVEHAPSIFNATVSIDARFKARILVQMNSQIFDRIGPWYNVHFGATLESRIEPLSFLVRCVAVKPLYRPEGLVVGGQSPCGCILFDEKYVVSSGVTGMSLV